MNLRSFLRPFGLLGLCGWLSLAGSSVAAAAEPKRPPQRYGRPAPRARAAAVLEWPARIVLAPLWAAFEIVLRQPNGAMIRAIENSSAVKHAQDKTSAGPWKELTIVPAATFDVGRKPLLGVNAAWRYHHNEVHLQAGTWGPDYVVARATERYTTALGQHASVETAVSRRRDLPFYGLGPRSEKHDRANYEANQFRMESGYDAGFWRSSAVKVALGGRGLWFGDGACCGDPPVAEAVHAGRLTAPGLDHDYAAAYQRFALSLDSRPRRAVRGFGFQLAAHEEATFAVHDPARGGGPHRSWLRWGGSLGADVDLTGTKRILAFAVHADFVDPLAGVVPFTDLASLGGDRIMTGYLQGRLVDRSAVTASVEYTWPVWVFLGGVMQASVGNVFGSHLHGFDAGALRYSAGIGLRSDGDARSRFQALVAVGSSPFDEGGRIDSVRFVVGTQHGL